MPVTWTKASTDYSIIVWHSTEHMDDLLSDAALNEAETKVWLSFRSETRKREWLTVRKVIQMMLPSSIKAMILYDSNGKPYIAEGGYVSISHSHAYIAVMTSANPEIGIDIELIHPRIEMLSKKFLGDNEKKNISDLTSHEKLHVVWGAKEVLYKIHSFGNIEFKTDLLVKPFHYNETGQLTASILKKGFERDYTIQYHKTGQFMLAWSIDE